MGLTKDYLDQKFEKFDIQLEELNNRMDNMATKADLVTVNTNLQTQMESMATKADLVAVNANLQTQMESMVTKADLVAVNANLQTQMESMVTKADLIAQTKELEGYTDAVASSIIEAVDSGFKKVHQRLEKVEIKY